MIYVITLRNEDDDMYVTEVLRDIYGVADLVDRVKSVVSYYETIHDKCYTVFNITLASN